MPGQNAQTARLLDDPKVIEQVEAYREALLQGQNPDRQQLLDQFPDIADELAACLNALEFVRGLAPRVNQQVTASLGEVSGHQHSPLPQALGDYRIVREVGRGGMGVVYEAQQISLGRKVALKVLPFAAMLDQKQLQRFQNEARAAASLKHPNIVQVYAVGCERAVHFYAMEYVEGQTLAEVIRNLRGLEGLEGGAPEDAGNDAASVADSLASGRFAPAKGSSDPDAPTSAYTQEQTPGPATETKRTPQAAISTERSTKSPAYFRSIAEIGVQVAEALDHAHQNGVVHRDVKPSNVILDNSGKPWVTDFGLARIDTPSPPAGEGWGEGVSLTMTGDLLGTVRYMSPEQALAKRIVVDHRTDVYSLGVTLYELLTLQPVFSGQDRQELLRQIAFDEPKAPRRLNRAIPEELEIIVLKAMAKNPAERYDTAQELADDLKRFLEDRPIHARRPTLVQRAAKWSRRHKPIVWSAAVSTLLLLVLGLVGLGIGNVMITKERDAKDQALVAKGEALDEKTAALKEKDAALELAQANLQKAEAQRQRAESNLTLALDALDTVYLRAIGRDRLLGDRNREEVQAELSNTEKTLIEAGLEFYAQIASQNEDSPAATFETGRAYLQIAMLQANLEEGEAADAAFLEAIARLKKLTESFPDNAHYFKQLGRAYYAKGNLSRWWPKAQNTFTEAVGALSKAIELLPKDAELYSLRGQAYERMSEPQRAADDYARALDLDPDNAKRHHRLAWFLYSPGASSIREHHEYLKYAKRAVELAPQHAYYRATLGYYYWRALNDRELALKELDTAIELDPNLPFAYNARSAVYMGSGDPHEALKCAEKAIQLAPNDRWHYRRRAEALRRLGRDEEALVEYNRVEQMYPNDRVLWWARGDLYAKLGDYEAALRDYDKSVELTPGHSLSYKRRASAHYRLGHYQEALLDLNKALELRPRDTSTLVWISTALVAKCSDQSFREGLLELGGKAVEKSPDPARALRDRTSLYLGLGEWKKGQADLEKALESETANHYPHYQHALLCLILNEAPKYRDACAAMVGKFAETDDPMAANFAAWTCALAPDAVDDYGPVLALATRAVEARPNSDQFLKSLAALLYRAGRHEEAIEWLTELDRPLEGPDAKASSSPGYTWYFLAMVHKKAGNEEQARRYLSEANAWTDDALADEESPPVWNRRATLELLRKEAEALAAAPDDGPEPSDRKSPEPSGDAGLSLSGPYQWVLHCRRARRFAAEENWTEVAGAFSRATELRPDRWELWKGRGEAHEKLDQWDQAIADYEKAIELKPEEWSFWKGRAESFAEAEKWDRALALYSSLIEHNSGNASLWKGRGEAHEKLDQWDEAIADYQKAIDLEPEEWSSWKARAEGFAQSEQCEKAIALYTTLVKHHSDNVELWQARAAAHFELKQWDQAIADYDQAIELNPDDAQTYVYRSKAHRRKGDQAKAIDDCTLALRINPKHAGALHNRAIAHRLSGHYNVALEDTNAGLMVKPEYGPLLHERALNYGHLGAHDKAIADYNEAIRLAPENAGLHKDRFEAYLALGRLDEALADWDRYVELGRDDAVAALIRAQMLLMADRTEDYRQACQEILDRFGQSERPATFCHAARACVLAPKAVPDPMVPVELATRAVSRDPRGWTSYTLGMAHLRARQRDEAEQRFHESLDAHPEWGAIFLNWLGLALVHHERGETEEARQWLGKAIESMEQHPAHALQGRIEGQLLRRELERLLGKPKQEKDDADSASEE